MLLTRGDDAEEDQRRHRSDVGMHDVQRRGAGDPHHRRRGVADDAAGAAGIRRRDDRREVANVHLAPEHLEGDGAADDRRRDVVEERRQYEDDHQQHKAAGPVIRQNCRHPFRQPALLEVAGQQGKADQQQEQVGDDQPLVAKMAGKSGETRSAVKAGQDGLVDSDQRQTGDGDTQHVMMKNGNAEQRRDEQQELQRECREVPSCDFLWLLRARGQSNAQ